MARNLTDRYIANLKPGQKRLHVFDAQVPGLCIRVAEGGKKTFTIVVRKDGKQKWRAVGPYPALSLAEARDKAREGLRRFHEGDEPFPKADPAPSSFAAITRTFLKRYVEKRGLRSQPEIERIFERYILPAWGERPIASIKRREVAELLDKIEDKNGPVQADRVLAVIRKLMNWHATRDDDFVSPVVPGMARTSPGERARDRVLSDAELRAIWPHLDGPFGGLVKTLLLTGQRKTKVASLRWEDIKDGVWHLPREDREKGNPGTLPLSRAALEVIESQPKIVGCDLVFPGRGGKLMQGFSRMKKYLDKRVPETLEPWTLHDLRRTARTLMVRAGTQRHIAERVLGHVIPGVEGVYDRHHYDAEKLDALERLAAEIDRILHPRPDNVRELRAAR